MNSYILPEMEKRMTQESNVVRVLMDKKYRTRGGDKVTILKTDLNNKNFPVLGIVTNKEGIEEARAWTSSGKCVVIFGIPFEGLKSDYDLIEVTPWDDLLIDELVLYKTNEDEAWYRGHFAGINDIGGGSFPFVWSGGLTSWTTINSISVVECRRPTQEEIERYIANNFDSKKSILFNK